MKKLIVSIIALSFISISPVFAKYSGGSGSEADPWQISCPNDLLYLVSHTEDYNSCFILINDINLADYTFTTAVIAPEGAPEFTGNFNGNDFVIRSLTIDTNGIGHNYLGLFGQTGFGCEIKNLGIEDINIIGGDGSIFLGGLVGENEHGNIINCHTTSTVTGGDTSAGLGGLVGHNWRGTISKCYATGLVISGDSSSYLGGLVGYNWHGTISNCYAMGAVTGWDNSQYLGGLAGRNYGTISNCYATGAVSGGVGANYFGGFVGYNYHASINNCFWDTQTSGMTDGVGYNDDGTITNLLGKTTADMQMQSTFAGTPSYWDFVGETVNGYSDYWCMPSQTGYPRLKWQVYNLYSGGSGSKSDPWQIAGPNDLLYLSGHTEDYGFHFILTSDINLAGFIFTTAVIAPDTDNSFPWDFDGTLFTGAFNGNGLVIRNLTIDTNNASNYFLGLFGYTYTGCEISNLGIEDFNITGGNESGFLGGLAGWNYGTISNCYASGVVSGGTQAGFIGGLVGWNDSGIISNCYATGTVAGGHQSGCIGGLIGENSQGTINNCYVTSTVNGLRNLGGLVGENWEANINNCFWDIDTSGMTDGVGNEEPDPNGVKGRTTGEMKKKDTFTGWDFAETWGIEDNQTYPFLRLTYPVADIDLDVDVDFVDFAYFAEHWLENIGP